jgi:probable F420-dependent oxidoreductase
MHAANNPDGHADAREKSECFSSAAAPSENDHREDAERQREYGERADRQSEACAGHGPRSEPEPPTPGRTLHEQQATPSHLRDPGATDAAACACELPTRRVAKRRRGLEWRSVKCCSWKGESVEIGVVYPQTELRGDPDAVRRIGRAVEDLGFEHLLVYDHVLGAVHADRDRQLTAPFTEQDPFHDPFVLFAYLAGITERIQFATGVLVLPQRQTALVARQAADVDLLSGGRLRLGVGVGWNHVEYEALGQDFATRGARQEEQIGLLRRLFTEPVVDFSGRFDRVDRAALVPKPTRSIPIWLGGRSEAAFERAARLADGFIFFGGGIDHAVECWNALRERLRGLGRSLEDFGADYVALPQSGGVDRLMAEIDVWREAGGTHVSVVTMDRGLASIEDHVEYLGTVAGALSLPSRG